MPGADLKPEFLNTQEQAWTAAAAAVLGRDGRPVRIALNGRDVPPVATLTLPLTAAATARNLDDRPVWQTVSTSGVTIEAPPAARNQMRVSRKFLTLNGDNLDLDTLDRDPLADPLTEELVEL